MSEPATPIVSRRLIGWALFVGALVAWGAALSTFSPPSKPALALAADEPTPPEPLPLPLFVVALALAAAHAFVTRDPAKARLLNAALGALAAAAGALVFRWLLPHELALGLLLDLLFGLLFIGGCGAAGVFGLAYVFTSRKWSALLLPLSAALFGLSVLVMSLANFSPG